MSATKFGVFIPQGWRLDLVDVPPAEQWEAMLQVARVADDTQFDSVWVYDHFHTVPAPTEDATHEAWTLMAALAASTSRVRLGQMCTCMGYRNPAYLAKVAATVDLISGGRVNFGIGAGWYEHEWRAYGYGFPGTGDRISALREGLQIMRQMWQDGISTYSGKIFSTDGAICQPKPLQEGGIPLWIAGGGVTRTLKYAAQWGAATNFTGTVEEFSAKLDVVRAHCETFDRDPATLTNSTSFNIVIGETEAEAQQKFDAHNERAAKALPTDFGRKVLQESDCLRGTAEQIADALRPYQAAGSSYFITYFPEAATIQDGMRQFDEQVIPLLTN
ncbi:LLM class F420-dependent oxidoreductase [Micrococcales bacterium 31B]|nr:LLM class F420-dependent oxidoreductase [Micrococcales bacterium 31B]